MIAFVALAETLGLEVILGAFAAGAILTLVDRDQAMTHPLFRRKLEAIGFGVFIPVFFVTTGLNFDLDALFGSTKALVMVLIFLAALLAVRGVPALLYRQLVGGQRAAIAGILQATSLPFIVAAAAIGIELGLLSQAESAALIAAGLMSVMIFPAAGLVLLRRAGMTPPAGAPVEPRGPIRRRWRCNGGRGPSRWSVSIPAADGACAGAGFRRRLSALRADRSTLPAWTTPSCSTPCGTETRKRSGA